jgi:transposase
MTNILGDEKRQEVLALGRLGWTLRRIEQATGVRRETASAYLKAAGITVRGRRQRRLVTPNPASAVSTDSGARAPGMTDPPSPPPPPGRAPTASACAPYGELIELALGRGRNAMAIWRDLVDDHGFTARYASVRRFVLTLRGQRPAEAHPVIVTAPGEEGQVDYGTGPMVRHPVTRKYRRTRLFIFTLGYSRKSVRLLTFNSSTHRWAELHEETFRRLGGAVKVVVLDNLREGVLTPDIYDPALNPVYRDVLAHYGAVALPCRVADPDRKGKVESAVNHTQGALTGLRFEDLAAGQAYLDRWDARWADTRIHGTTKRQVAAMFAEERPALGPLPVEPFRYYQFGTRTVHLDGCVEIDYAYYGAPPGWLGREVAVQWNATYVRLLEPSTGRLLREHRRQTLRGQHAMHPADRPARTPPTTVTLLARATHAGPQIGTLCAAIHQRDGALGVRRILGVLGLAKKYGPAAVEDACAAALELGVAEYRFVRRYLDRHPPVPLTLRQVDPLIRDLTHYRDVIARKTQEEIPT